MPLACAPTAIAGRNRMMRTMIVDDIEQDPEWNHGDYRHEPVRGIRAAMGMLFVMVSAPLVQQRQAPTRAAADSLILGYLTRQAATHDANDVVYAFEASRDYDPSPRLASVMMPVLAINSADDFVNPPELGLMERLMPRVPKGRYVLIPRATARTGTGHTRCRPCGAASSPTSCARSRRWGSSPADVTYHAVAAAGPLTCPLYNCMVIWSVRRQCRLPRRPP